MKYFVIVLPMAKDGTVNRQMYAFDDFESAKQSFHSNCAKYFKADALIKASVCILTENCVEVMNDIWDSGLAIEVPTEEVEN